jgi:hypothetical protein
LSQTFTSIETEIHLYGGSTPEKGHMTVASRENGQSDALKNAGRKCPGIRAQGTFYFVWVFIRVETIIRPFPSTFPYGYYFALLKMVHAAFRVAMPILLVIRDAFAKTLDEDLA